MTKHLWKEEVKKKLLPPEEIPNQVKVWKENGVKTVTLNGSFDLLHAGHLQIFYEAKAEGDLLIVALNTDASIQKYKGPDRPIIPLEYRLQMVAALEFVDFVTWFDEEDPRSILKQLRPSVHVNGSEYAPRCLESDVVEEGGGTVHYVERLPGLATSEILNKIRTTDIPENQTCASSAP